MCSLSMLNLSRDQVRKILEYLEAETNITQKQLWRVLEKHGGILRDGVDTAEERKFGHQIRPQERGDFFDEIAKEMHLTHEQQRKLRYAISPQHIRETLRRIEKEAKNN